MANARWLQSYRSQRFEHCPWFFNTEATVAEKAVQAAHVSALAEVAHAVVGDSCYIAPSASVSGHADNHLHLGDHGFIAARAYVTDRVKLGDHCTINPFATLRGPIVAGDGVRIGAYACLVGFNHGFADITRPIWQQKHTSKGIVLGDDIWIGAHATILDGVRVGSHAIVAAGAVVTRDVPDYAIVGGNPARVIRMRDKNEPVDPAIIGETRSSVKPANATQPARVGAPALSVQAPQSVQRERSSKSSSLERKLTRFGNRVGDELDSLLATYRTKTADGDAAYINEKGGRKRVRPWCDAIEIAAMFGRIAPGYTKAEWVTRLRGFQDPVTGLVPEHLPEHREFDPPAKADPKAAWRYNTMIVNYALECMGSNIAYPVTNAAEIKAPALRKHLAGLPWENEAWHAGDWVDCYGSSLLPNVKYFGQHPPLAELFKWLDKHCDSKSGLWGRPNKDTRWLQPVNGFYRLTRGTYAQFGRPLPMPEKSIDTVLSHARDPEFFSAERENACNVLDVVHPLWLCLKQTDHRRDEAQAWVAKRLPAVLAQWHAKRGFDFVVAGKKPSLQGTEMWLSIAYLMADLLGCADALGYRPQGVHRLEPAFQI